ncbi:Copper resistance protein A precursor [Maioricimonas rarisocia]|uniref:Copper resistance protein A n=1 Tax=Maioricimonas rarisocia TaxID=2528026 RepID=A0A517ZCE5_9PLAN|nr:copper oxidase [Maioricimonas rarisocia]QDU40110.1 Copper resistance protein A precursor [Maioricimonas rarisocia]
MTSPHAPNGRREFLKQGTLAAVALSTGSAMAQQPQSPPPPPKKQPVVEHPHDHVKAEYDGFSRYQPSRGNSPDSDFYLGKLVPGFRKPEEGPAPFVAPDLQPLSWEMKNGAKEFHLVCQQVEREFLPGYRMVVWGFNGSMPGPTIEVTQGDRVRLVVHNELPEETSVHWHGFELPVQFDGSHTLTQNPIKPGKTFVYEFDVHEEGTFFYHSHVAMQETMGMVGWFIVHPRKPFDPPVDRDFGLIFQNFAIMPNQTVNDSFAEGWNWHTINGRSGPYTTPLVVRHGERVRIRIMDFSPIQHHPIHIHGHTFWVTGHEGARAPKSAWIPRNTELIAVAQASEFEFIANNPGDWMFHCHMTHHMMNHMVTHVGPRSRPNQHVDQYLANLDRRPQIPIAHEDPAFAVPGYPQGMKGMEMSEEFMKTIWLRREFMGMRATAPKSLKGLMTALRVLPDDLYSRVMESDEPIEKGAIFQEIVNRFGTPAAYEPAPKMMMH